MLRHTRLLFALALCACSSNNPAPTDVPVADTQSADVQSVDAQSVDAQSVDAQSVDAQSVDAQSVDAQAVDVTTGVDVFDGGAGDAVVATDALSDAGALTDAVAVDAADAGTWSGSDEILGTLRGTCGTVRGMLHSPSPSFVRNDLTFMAPERYLRDALSPGGQRLFDTANAGGSSGESEVMAFEVLHYCEGASLLRTETEIHYAPADDSGANSITDILVEVGGERVGVSVTRAYLPRPMVFTDAAATELISRKLIGINRSSMRVLPGDRWVKQVLHVLAVDAAAADAVERAWRSLDAATRADTVVVVTVTHGGGFIYCNPDPALGAECPPIGG